MECDNETLKLLRGRRLCWRIYRLGWMPGRCHSKESCCQWHLVVLRENIQKNVLGLNAEWFGRVYWLRVAIYSRWGGLRPAFLFLIIAWHSSWNCANSWKACQYCGWVQGTVCSGAALRFLCKECVEPLAVCLILCFLYKNVVHVAHSSCLNRRLVFYRMQFYLPSQSD